MKFAFSLFKYFPYGGLQRDALRIAEACRARGHAVDFHTLRWEGPRPAGHGVEVVAVPGRLNHVRYRRFAAHMAARSRGYDAHVGFNRMPGLDVYYAADPCYRARLLARAPWHRLTPRARALLAAEHSVFAPGARTLVLGLDPARSAEYRACYGTESQRIVDLPPGIARDRQAPPDAGAVRAAQRAELGLGADDYLLLLIGSGFRMKGLDRALRGLSALPAALRARSRLLVLGRDKEAPFRRLARRLGVADRFEIRAGSDAVPRFLQAADLLLHPAYRENTGTVLLEAVVAGLPLLVSGNCGYAHHVARAGAGVVLPEPFRQADFDRALAELLDDAPRRQRLRQAGIAYGRSADLYGLPERAAALIEAAAERHT